MNINIIGKGFVGSAFCELLDYNNFEYNVYDVNKQKSMFQSIKDLVEYNQVNNTRDIYIICVPTPSLPNGDCNTIIVENVIKQLNDYVIKLDKTHILIKSTVKPGASRMLQNKYPDIPIIFCPEFLRELTAVKDTLDSRFVLLGTENGQVDPFIETSMLKMFKHNPDIEIVTKKYEEAEMFKYTLNTFLATKITYFNEIYDICNKLDINYQDLKQLFRLDPRIGEYGTRVPGDDGRGYSKSCLPKEIRAMAFLQQELGLSSELLDTIIKRNKFFRKE